MTALALMSVTTTVIACSDKNMDYYSQFMSGVNNKENFIFMVSAKNCIHCQNTTDTTIPDLYDGNGHGNHKYK